MNFARKTRPSHFFVRAAGISVLGVLALMQFPAHAGVLYDENFSQVTLGPSPNFTFNAFSQLQNSGLYVGWDNSANTYPNSGGSSYNLMPSGWSVVANSQSLGAGGDVEMYGYNGSYAWTSDPPSGACSYGGISYQNCGVLINSVNGGGIQDTAVGGLTAGVADVLTITYWGSNAALQANNYRPYVIKVTINGVATFVTSTPYNGGSTGAISIASIPFTPTGNTASITIQDMMGDNIAPAAIIGDIQVSTAPEPASALFLLAPAGWLLYRRRRSRNLN